MPRIMRKPATLHTAQPSISRIIVKIRFFIRNCAHTEYISKRFSHPYRSDYRIGPKHLVQSTRSRYKFTM